jgi:hypothetical protein
MKALVCGFEVAIKFYCQCRVCGAEAVEETSLRITQRGVHMSIAEVEKYLRSIKPYNLNIPIGWSSNGRDSKGQILWCNKCTGG